MHILIYIVKILIQFSEKLQFYTPQPIESIDRVDHKLGQVESIEKSSTRSTRRSSRS